MSDFSNALRRERKAAGITITTLSQRTGSSIGYLSDIERGNRYAPPLEIVERFEAALGIPDGRLLKIARVERALQPKALSDTLNRYPKILLALRNAVKREIEKDLKK